MRQWMQPVSRMFYKVVVGVFNCSSKESIMTAVTYTDLIAEHLHPFTLAMFLPPHTPMVLVCSSQVTQPSNVYR